MAVDLGDLLDPLRSSLNTPGDVDPLFTFEGKDSEWIDALANGFWWAHLRGFFADHRVTLAGDHIENVVGGDDLDRKLQQVIVLFTAMMAIDTKLLWLPTHEKDSAKPGLETEVDRSANLLRDLRAGRRADLEEIKVLILGGVYTTDVAVIDLFLAHDANLRAGTGTYVLG